MQILIKILLISQISFLFWRFAVLPYTEDRSPANSRREFYLAAHNLSKGQLVEAQKHLNYVLVNYNGDLTLWSVYLLQAAVAYRRGDIPTARATAESALRLNPEFQPAKNLLRKVQEIERYQYIEVPTQAQVH